MKARIDLDSFTLSIPLYRGEEHLLQRKPINKYECIEIFECDYNNKVGIMYIDKDDFEKESLKNIRSNIFLA